MRSLTAMLILGFLSMGPVPAGADDSSSTPVGAQNLARLKEECARAREAKIAPLRAAEIAKCKTTGRNDPDYCDRFWANFGDAHRGENGAWIPRMFDDLPECVAAANAEKQQ